LGRVFDTTLVELDLPQVQEQRKSKRNAGQERADHWNPQAVHSKPSALDLNKNDEHDC
jgi:hypothetical protein